MLDLKSLYDVYKEYAWREYGLVDRRANWIYVANTVLAVGLGFIIQEQVSLMAQKEAMHRIMEDQYTVTIYSISKLAVLAIPVAAVFINIALWTQLMAASKAAESVRLRWRLIRDDPNRGAGELPYLSFGFHDAGPRMNGLLITSLLPASLIFFWGLVAFVGFCLLYPDLYQSLGVLLQLHGHHT